jgi:hypothetical protein
MRGNGKALKRFRTLGLLEYARASVLSTVDRMLPTPLSRLRPALRLRRLMRDVTNSKLFDAEWYLQHNPDVAICGIPPLEHFVRHGIVEDRKPSAFFDPQWYMENNDDVRRGSISALEHYLYYGAAERREPAPYFNTSSYLFENPTAKTAPTPLSHFVEAQRQNGFDAPPLRIDQIVAQRMGGLHPLRVFASPRDSPRVTLITDSINANQLFGGVGTAIVVASLLAKRRCAGLRILTRRDRGDPQQILHILSTHGVSWEQDIELVHAHVDTDARVDVATNELFLTTSWWSTWAAMSAVKPNRIVYLLQEDERMFYPHGDEHLRCSEVLASRDIRFVVNSKMLFEHLVNDGLDAIGKRGCWFEPAFPLRHYFPDPSRSQGRSNFLFYARPNHLRNLYVRGLEVLQQSILSGVLDPKQWNFHVEHVRLCIRT